MLFNSYFGMYSGGLSNGHVHQKQSDFLSCILFLCKFMVSSFIFFHKCFMIKKSKKRLLKLDFDSYMF